MQTQRRGIRGKVPVSFSRASAAYKLDGTQVVAHQPRYEWGRFQNLLTKNQSDAETDLIGIGSNNAGVTRTRLAEAAKSGSYGVRVDCNGTVGYQGLSLAPGVSVVVGKAYIVSAFVRGASGTVHITAAGATNVAGVLSATMDGTWKRLFTIATATSTNLITAIHSGATPVTIVFDYDEGMVEEALPGQTLPTAWRPGQTGKGLMVEEGTTNLITNGGFETNITGWSKNAGTEVFVHDTSVYRFGIASFKMTTVGTAGSGVYTSLGSLTAGVTYTLSFWHKGALGANTIAQLNGAGFSYFALRTIPGAGDWGYYVSTFTPSNTGSCVLFFIVGNVVTTINLDNIQIEAKAYATSWTPDTRVGETTALPKELFTPYNGTIEGWFNIPVAANTTRPQACRLFSALSASAATLVGVMRFGTVTDRWALVMRETGAGTLYTADLLDTSMTPGWHFISVRWEPIAGNTKAFVDGVLRATINYIPKEAAGLPVYIGCDNANTQQCGALFDSLRISDRARTDAEILAAYNSLAPFAWDESTTYLQQFDDNMNQDIGTAGMLFRSNQNVLL
jgi:hypothetical protein